MALKVDPNNIQMEQRVKLVAELIPKKANSYCLWYKGRKFIGKKFVHVINRFRQKDFGKYKIRCNSGSYKVTKYMIILKIGIQKYTGYKQVVNINDKHRPMNRLELKIDPNNIQMEQRIRLVAELIPKKTNSYCLWYRNRKFIGKKFVHVIHRFRKKDFGSYKIRCNSGSYKVTKHMLIWKIGIQTYSGYNQVVNINNKQKVLKMNYKFKIIFLVLPHFPINEGSLISLKAQITPSPGSTVKYVWYKNNRVISNTELYVIKSIHKQDLVIYKCIITFKDRNGKRYKLKYEKDMSDYVLKRVSKINYKFKIIFLVVPHFPINEGSLISLKAQITPSPGSTVKYVWYKNNRVISNTEVYVIKSIHKQDLVIYKCIITFKDRNGKRYKLKYEKNMSHFVLKPVKVDYKYKIQMSAHGKTIILDVITTPHSNKLKYEWSRNGKMIYSGQKYVIKRFGTQDIASYDVVVRDSRGPLRYLFIDCSSVYLRKPTKHYGIYIDRPKQIKKGSSVLLVYGSNVKLGADVRTFWLKNGRFITTSPVLAIKNFGINDLAVYKVVIISRNYAPKLIHQIKTIDLTSYVLKRRSRRYRISIKHYPIKIKMGEKVKLTIDLLNRISNVKYVWYKNNELFGHGEYMIISNFGVKDLAFYKVVIISTNDRVPYIHEWAYFDLTRTSILKQRSNQVKVRVVMQPKKVEEGKSVFMQAIPSVNNVKIIWFKDGVFYGYESVYIRRFSIEDMASYRCVILSRTSTGPFIQYYEIVDLTTYPMKSIKKHNSDVFITSSKVDFRFGDFIKLFAIVSAKLTNVEYYWYKNNDFYQKSKICIIPKFSIRHLAIFKLIIRSKIMTSNVVWISILKDYTAVPFRLTSPLYKLYVIQPTTKLVRNSKYSLTCQIIPPNPKVRLMWYKNGNYFSRQSTITFYKFDVDDLASYKCLALSSLSSKHFVHDWTVIDYSTKIIVPISTVSYMTSISISKLNVKKGDKVHLNAVVEPPITNVIYYWYRDGDFVGSGERLTISYFSVTDVKFYKFTVRSISASQRPYILIVNYRDLTKLVIQKPYIRLNVTIVPSTFYVKRGMDITLNCNVQQLSKLRGMVEYRWYKNGMLVGNKPIYKIYKFDTDDLASYKCLLLSKLCLGPYIHAWNSIDYSRVDIFPPSPAGATSYQVKVLYEIRGKNIVLKTRLYPPATNVKYVWYLNGEFVSYGLTLMISKGNFYSLGFYRVFILSASTNSRTFIHVSQQRRITMTNINVSFQKKYKVNVRMYGNSIACLIIPQAKDIYVSWFKNDVLMNGVNNPVIKVRSGCISTKTLYTCEVKSFNYVYPPIYVVGTYTLQPRASKKSKLPIPFHHYISMSGDFKKGQPLLLICNTGLPSNPKLFKFQWFKNNKVIGRKTMHMIPSLSSCDNGVYLCKVIINTFASFSSAFINVV